MLTWRISRPSTTSWSTSTGEPTKPLNDCTPGNILRELAKRADRKELDQAKKELEQVKTENAQLNAQVSAMAQELSQKSEEIRKYHAEQSVVFRRIRELIGELAEAVNKARLYDQLMRFGDPITAGRLIPSSCNTHS